jgi:YesN/AraC family two-component response regulator
MLINNKLMYEKEHLIKIGNPSDNLYYFFDYDERSYQINMEFQHFHHFYEIHILLDTNANHIIEGTLHNIKLFDIVCLKPYLLHKSEYPEGSPKKRLIIQFNIPRQNIGSLQNQLDEVMSIFEDPLPIYRFDPKYQDTIIELVNNIYQISKAKSLIHTLSIHSRFLDLLCTLYQYRKHNIYKPEIMNSTSSKIYSITSYIHNHFHEELSLDILAKNFFLSNYYLSHLFKEVTGFTLINYIQMTRVRNAQQLLLFTDKKITDIAEQCGFTSFSQFNRVFNKFCHTSPRNFKLQANDVNTENDGIPIVYTRD